MKLQELNNWLKELKFIIIDLNISINSSKYLIKEEGTKTVESIKELSFFKHYTYQLKFITIIQLSKFFGKSKNQKTNINKLLNKLKNEGYDTDLNNLLLKNLNSNNGYKHKQDIIKSINFLEKEIQKSEATIAKLVDLRDKVYAHNQPNKVLKDVYWNELELLIILAAKCYDEVYKNLHHIEVKFEKTLPWEVKRIIVGLAYYKDFYNNN
ncbi:hypothetical protein RRF68_11530 [Tenacibaculum sp. HL-MS23]|uniref:AbiU2 domain-containing protein n=1 Tax=unclassified Tenacibaculum TaxID=2635139 RepID=UPI001C4FB00F|nr:MULTISPECIES: hypothetical protein [unclassified Tenacibaculum]QXP73554.1 hypothetical protein H0I30_12885 [Tenacibaculum sp. AHE14PA]QXP75068.1 hypothetical protein H0I31_07625 [Tenacibaculum sp. AHE15PA]WNW01613.1 hypothetical protein RRF68_11530 [Tenacibaculum sp. HL-MS23]